MRFSAKEDIELDQDAAFAAVTDAAFIERLLLRRGIDVTRVDHGDVGLGSQWHAKADLRGKTMAVALEVIEWQGPDRAALKATMQGVTGHLVVEFAAMTKHETRVRATLTAQAAGIRARMLLNSLVLGRSRLERRFAEVLRDYLDSAARRAARV